MLKLPRLSAPLIPCSLSATASLSKELTRGCGRRARGCWSKETVLHVSKALSSANATSELSPRLSPRPTSSYFCPSTPVGRSTDQTADREKRRKNVTYEAGGAQHTAIWENLQRKEVSCHPLLLSNLHDRKEQRVRRCCRR